MTAAGAAPPTDEPSPLERALGHLLTSSIRMKPDELAARVAEACATLGGRDPLVLLVDLSQRTLCELPADPASPARELAVDSGGAGAAYRDEAAVRERTDDGIRLWLPILDSAERVGVLGVVLPAADPRAVADWVQLAGLIGELVVTKSRYGDRIGATRRTAPVSLAAELRWGLLPPLTYTSSDVVVSGILEPAHDIAGDTFDYAVNGEEVRLAVFDAMGHGLLASRMADLAVGTHRNNRRRGADLVDDVRTIDRVVLEQFGEWRYVTAHLASLDLASGVLHSISAGHPPAVVFHADGTLEEVRSSWTRPLGLGAAPEPPAHTQLRPGDVVLFHTDGVDEARSPDGEFFGLERLRRSVRGLLDAQLRPAEVLRRVVQQLLEHQQELADDATLLLLGWRIGADAIAPAARVADEVVGPTG